MVRRFTLGLLIIILSALTSCVSMEKYQRLSAENEVLALTISEQQQQLQDSGGLFEGKTAQEWAEAAYKWYQTAAYYYSLYQQEINTLDG